MNNNIATGSPIHGIPFPGTYVLDEKGFVRSKFFEADYAERVTAGAILTRHFQTRGGASVSEAKTSHLKVSTAASNSSVWPGAKITLTMEVEMKNSRTHVYAPGVHDSYIPVRWSITPGKAWLVGTAAFPQSKTCRLAAIRETVPVFEGRFRIVRDLTFGEELGDSTNLTVEGDFLYQACDDKVCYQPQRVPLKWIFERRIEDTERVPVTLRPNRVPE